MTFKETQKMLNFLRAAGVNHFKSGDFEVSFATLVPMPIPPAIPARQSKSKTPAHGGAIPPVPSEIPHHVNEVKRLLKLNDEDLVNEMFPEGAPQQPKDE